MEWLDSVWAQIASYVDVPYIIIFMLLSYIVKKSFGDILQKITKFNWLPVYTVLIIATIVAIPFLIWSRETWVNIAFSYALGTSLHELIFQWIENKFKTGDKGSQA